MNKTEEREKLASAPTRHGFDMRRIAYWLSLVLIFVIPWENVVDVAGIGTISRATGIFVTLFWLCTLCATGRIRRPSAFHVAFLVFVIWNAISAMWSLDVEKTMDHLQTYAQLFVMVFILWDLYYTTEALHAGLQAYILGAYVSAVSTISNFLVGDTQEHYNAYAATGFNTGGLAVILALGLPVAWYLATSTAQVPRWLRWVNFAYIPAGFLALVLTGNRAGLIACVPAILLAFWTTTVRQKVGTRVAIFSFLLFSALMIAPLVPAASIERLGTIGGEISEADLNGRVTIWREGMHVFADHSLVGVGSGAFRSAVGLNKVAHNVFVSVLVELGLVGFFLFGIVLISVAISVRRQSLYRTWFWIALFLAWAMCASALSLELRKTTWLFFALAVAGAHVSVGVQANRNVNVPEGLALQGSS